MLTLTYLRQRYPDSVRCPATICFLLTAAFALKAQIPPSETLSPGDSKAFQAEVERVKSLLETAGDKCTVQFALARTWASGGQWRQALDNLRQAIDLNVGLDPFNDETFRRLHGTNEYNLLLRQVRDSTPAVANSRAAFTIDKPDLFPEGIAWEPRRKRFFIGSTWGHNVMECTAAGDCNPLVKNGQDGLFEVLGIKADTRDRSIWVASNSPGEAGLFHYETPSGTLLRKFTLTRGSEHHYFNDIAVSSKGDVFVTDTQAGSVYWVSAATQRLEIFDANLKVQAANGIAISDDDKTLYVAGFPNGITVVDLASGMSHAMKHPAGLCLGTIDGLVYFKGSLIAIQNGIMTPRVVRFKLSPDFQEIAGFDVLERRNPAFDGISTGALADGAFYYIANTQADKLVNGRIRPNTQLSPVQILRLDLAP